MGCTSTTWICFLRGTTITFSFYVSHHFSPSHLGVYVSVFLFLFCFCFSLVMSAMQRMLCVTLMARKFVLRLGHDEEVANIVLNQCDVE